MTHFSKSVLDLLVKSIYMLLIILDKGSSVYYDQHYQGDQNNLNYLSSNNYLYLKHHRWDPTLQLYHGQSPIHIKTADVEEMYVNDKLRFIAFDSPDITYLLQNNGHGVQLVVDPELDNLYPNMRLRPRLKGGILRDEYIFENLHFHWGEQGQCGSEHYIDDKCYSLEGHMVTFKKEYGTFNMASKHHNGLVVFTFLANSSPYDNNEMNVFLQHMDAVIHPNSPSQKVKGSDAILWFVHQLSVQLDGNSYYVYPGSLTTNPFSDIATFIVVPTPVQIGEHQLERLRQLIDEHGHQVRKNYREIQPNDGRPIIYVEDNIEWDIKPLSKFTSLNPYQQTITNVLYDTIYSSLGYNNINNYYWSGQSY